MAIIKLTKENFVEEVMGAATPVLIDFYADWCGPCRMLAPTVDALADRTDIKVCKVNVDNEREIASLFKVQSIPLVAIVKDNTYVDMSVGYVPKEKLAALIEEYR